MINKNDDTIQGIRRRLSALEATVEQLVDVTTDADADAVDESAAEPATITETFAGGVE